MEKAGKHKPLVILGSVRKESSTRKLVDLLFEQGEAKILDLLDYKIHHYDYAGKYPPDDAFPALAEELLQHQVLVFATPVYWYSMSGHMKVLFDRLTDLVTINKKLGRQLQGKKVALVAVGSNDALPPGFETPFQLTAEYLDMTWVASYYCTTAALKHRSQSGAATFTKMIGLAKS